VRAFLTGGTGFVGANVARSLRQAGYEVRCLVRASSCLDNLQDLEVERVEGDLNDPNLHQQMRGCQVLFHVLRVKISLNLASVTFLTKVSCRFATIAKASRPIGNSRGWRPFPAQVACSGSVRGRVMAIASNFCPRQNRRTAAVALRRSKSIFPA